MLCQMSSLEMTYWIAFFRIEDQDEQVNKSKREMVNDLKRSQGYLR